MGDETNSSIKRPVSNDRQSARALSSEVGVAGPISSGLITNTVRMLFPDTEQVDHAIQHQLHHTNPLHHSSEHTATELSMSRLTEALRGEQTSDVQITVGDPRNEHGCEEVLTSFLYAQFHEGCTARNAQLHEDAAEF